MAKSNEEELDKIHRLVQSTDQKNVAVGLEILKNYPSDKQKLTYTFVLGFFHPESTVRRKAKAWFKKEAPKEFYDEFSKEINFSKIYGKIHNGYPHAPKILTPILEQVLAKDVLDADILGKYMLDLWAGSWEFCCKQGIGNDSENLKRIQDKDSLYLSYTWPDFPKGLWKMKQIFNLIIVNRQLTCIPNEITQLVHLKSLELYTNLKEFPVSILGLPQLQQLHLHNTDANFYDTIPDDIVNLKNLKSLQVESLPKELPLNICKIKNLEALALWGFKETKLLDEITQLQKLTTINLEHSRNLDWEHLFIQLSQFPN